MISRSMKRTETWIHLSLIVLMIVIAGIAGQIERWRSALTSDSISTKEVVPIKSSTTSSRPEILVRFKPEISFSLIRQIAASNNDVVIDEVESVNGLTIIDDLDNADPAESANAYIKLPGVEYAEPNFTVKTDKIADFNSELDLLKPNDPEFEKQWALNNTGGQDGIAGADIAALKAWSKTKGSKDVVVAVLDTGVDLRHVDLEANLWKRPANISDYSDDELGIFNDLNGFNGFDKLADPIDDNGHGTHCAGIIGAEGDNGEGIAGVNWQVKIMPVKVLDGSGVGSGDETIEGINYIIDRKKKGVNIRVISASLGSTQYSKALEDAIKAANDAGILVVAAAGNDGVNTDVLPHYPSSLRLPNLISVAAIDRKDQLTSFSNFGKKTVDIAAPGKDIYSTWLNSTYRNASGTSMATPYVSGIAALMIAAEPNISAAELRKRIISTAIRSDSLKNKVSADGRVNAAAALGRD